MLRRNYRDRLFARVKSFFHTSFENIREVFQNGIFTKWTHIFPYKFCIILFHLCKNSLAQKISRLKFFCKSLSVLIIQKCAFPSYRF